MSDDIHFTRRQLPSRIARLGFGLELPGDWIEHTLPKEEDPDFDDPLRMVGLAVITAPQAALIWAVAARPVYQNGTLSDWAGYLLEHAGLQPRTHGEGRLGTLPALVGEAVLQGEMGPMLVRYAFAEDGGRLINATLTAPMLLARAVHEVWQRALESFRLDDPQGSTVPLWPPATQPLIEPQGEPEPEPEPAAAPVRPGADDDTPPWLRAAHALEQAGHLKEAELAITSALDHIGASLAVADLYLQRSRRLQASGDDAGAAQAAEAARRWTDHYAASATGGGEGTALLREVRARGAW